MELLRWAACFILTCYDEEVGMIVRIKHLLSSCGYIFTSVDKEDSLCV
jgi:hypothetical protein